MNNNVNEKRLVDDFIRLVKIDSETKNELQMADTLYKDLTDLGFKVSKLEVPAEIGSNGYNIYAILEGTKEGNIMYSCHMDTVTPGNNIKPVINGDIITSDGTTILGSDDKSGIAAILESIRVIKENNLEHKTIEIAFTIYEEGGLFGAKNFDVSILKSKNACVFDSGGEIGTIINQAPAQTGMTFKIIGKPAHAGLAPETGINALTVLSHAITKMNLSRIDEETTANIGIVSGGQATNIVMPEVTVKAEARSLNNDKLNKQVDHMVSVLEDTCKEFGATLEKDVRQSYQAFNVSDDNEFLQDVKETLASLNYTPKTVPTGGGSDANIFATKGLTCLNLSTGMSKVHTKEEFQKISDLIKITNFIVAYSTK